MKELAIALRNSNLEVLEFIVLGGIFKHCYNLVNKLATGSLTVWTVIHPQPGLNAVLLIQDLLVVMMDGDGMRSGNFILDSQAMQKAL